MAHLRDGESWRSRMAAWNGRSSGRASRARRQDLLASPAGRLGRNFSTCHGGISNANNSTSRKLIKRDLNDPPKYSFKPLPDIGRDEMGRLSAPKTYDPTPEEIRLACLEIQREWSPQEEYSRRMYKTEPVDLQRTGCHHDSHGGIDFS